MGDVIRFSLPIELDDDGYLDRQCPWSECGRPFKVMNEDWENKVSAGIAYCPFCGHEAEPSDFNTPEQTEYFREAAMAEMHRQLGLMLSSVARDFNRRMPKRGLIPMRMDVSSPSIAVPMLPDAQALMTLHISCEQCECRFAVIGAGFFCPACGHNSADHTFDQAVAAARKALTVLPSIRDSVLDADARDQVTRHLIEAQIGNLVTAFQRFAEASYPRLPHYEKPPRRNAFQNIADGDRLWSQAGGTSYTAILDAAELEHLHRLFQQRHLLTHREGLVDTEYLEKSNDKTYVLGQRLVIREPAVHRLAELVEKLASGLRRDVQGTPVPSGTADIQPGREGATMLPRIAGITETDMRVFQLACDHALATGDSEIGGQLLWGLTEAEGISRTEFVDAIEILKSKHLVTAARPLARGSLPALVTIAARGLDVFLPGVIEGLSNVRQQIACAIVNGATSSGQIEAIVSQPSLVVKHVRSDFSSRRWLKSRRIRHEIYVAGPTVELRRLCQES